MSLLDLFQSTPKPPVGSPQELIHWDECLCVGNALIDGEHRQIVEALNRFYADWIRADHHLDMEAELRHLTQTVETHFANEEELLNRRHCPTLAGHTREHRQLLAELHAIASNFTTLGSAKLEARLLRFIRKLVVAHVLSWDMDARDYLRT